MGTAGSGGMGAAGAGNPGAAGAGSGGAGGATSRGSGSGVSAQYQGKVITEGGCGCEVGNSGTVGTFGVSILGVALAFGRRRGSRHRGDHRR
jgi:MYXO-CTERM domain-containing protein